MQYRRRHRVRLPGVGGKGEGSGTAKRRACDCIHARSRLDCSKLTILPKYVVLVGLVVVLKGSCNNSRYATS